MATPPLKEYVTAFLEVSVTIGPGEVFQKNKNIAKETKLESIKLFDYH